MNTFWQKQAEFIGHSAPIYACVSHKDWLYSSSGDKFVTRWSISKQQQDNFAIHLDSPAYSLCLIQHSSLLIACCTNGTIVAIDVNSKQLLWEHNFFGKAIFSSVELPNEKLIVFGDAEGQLGIVDFQGNLQANFQLNCGKIRQLISHGNKMFSASQDGKWRQFELPTFNEIQTQYAHEGGVNTLLYFPNSHTLLTGGKDAHLRLWDIISQQELISIAAHYQTIYGIYLTNDFNKIVSVSMDKTIKIWDAESWKVEQRIEFKQGGHSRSVNGCLITENNKIITFSDDKKIIVWTTNSEEEIDFGN